MVQGPQRPRSPKAHGVETSSLTSPVRPCIHQAVNYNDPEHKAANDAWVQSLREEAQAIKDGQERIKRQAQRVAERAARHRELTRLAEAYQRERERKREAIRVEAERQAIAFAYEYAVSHNIPGRNQQPPKTDCNSDGQSSNFSQKLKERLDLAVSNSEKNRRLTAKPIEPVAPSRCRPLQRCIRGVPVGWLTILVPICWEEVESDTTTAESCRDDSESEDEQEESPTARKSAQSQTRLPRTATPLHNRKRTDSKDEDEDASPITREAARSQHCALRQATPSPGTERVGANDGQYREPLAAPSLDPERGGVHLSLEVAEVGYRPAICREVSAPRRRTAKRARHEQPAAGDNKRRRHAVPGTAE